MSGVDHWLLIAGSWLLAYTLYNKVPRCRIENIEEGPQRNCREKPVSGVLKTLPYLCEVELCDHQYKHSYTEDKESILILFVHSYA